MAIAGATLVAALHRLGHRTMYGVPGESYLPVLDALSDFPDFEYVTCRHEGGAAFMACATARLEGRASIVAVSRGPGLTNASIGLHTAMQDALPVIALVGLSETHSIQRRAFQEICLEDWRGLVKGAFLLDSPLRVDELVVRAQRLAVSGRPGPVLLAAPEDLLYQAAPSTNVPANLFEEPHAHQSDVLRVHAALTSSSRAIILVGGSIWSTAASKAIETYCTRNNLAVTTSFRSQDYVDNASSQYIGDVGFGISPSLVEALRQADVVVALGLCLDDPTTDSYTRTLGQRLIQVVPDATEAQYAYPGEIIVANPAQFACALARCGTHETRQSTWIAAVREALETARNTPYEDGVDVGAAMRMIAQSAPGTIICNGSGNYAAFVRKHYAFRDFGTQLAPKSGAMGYAVPAAIAAARSASTTRVVSVNGDGCFTMNSNELATLDVAKAPIMFIIVDNAQYGTIATFQRSRFPGRPQIGTALKSPDFVALGKAYGVQSQSCHNTLELLDAVSLWLKGNSHALLHVSQ
jgi:acetolactate synthase I/II/III large subunit